MNTQQEEKVCQHSEERQQQQKSWRRQGCGLALIKIYDLNNEIVAIGVVVGW